MTPLLPLLLLAATTRPAPKAIDCPHLPAPPTIDGKLDDPAWANVPWTDDFLNLHTGHKADVTARAKLAWDDDHLYVAAHLESRDIRATKTRRDTSLHNADDVFELFLDPDGDGRDYCELQINAHGTVMDLLMTKPYDLRGRADLKWDLMSLRAATSVDGTLNDPSDTDRAWTVELAIPWSSINAKPGQPLRLQLAHVRHTAGADPTYLVWSPQTRPTYHAPAEWGTLRLISASAASQKTSGAAKAAPRPSPGDSAPPPPSP